MGERYIFSMNDTNPIAFEAALTLFLVKVQGMVDTYFAANFPNSKPPRIEACEGGVKYVRIVQVETVGSGCSAWAFVERATGNVLKPDGFKRPAKHSRGNIYNENPLAGMGPHGPGYLR